MVRWFNNIHHNRRSRMTSIVPYARQFKRSLRGSTSAVELVNPKEIDAACSAVGHRWRQCFWTPTVTILTFLRQILHANCSCRQGVALTLVAATAKAGDTASGDPSAYSQARQKLPRRVLESLNAAAVRDVRTQASPSRSWCGRTVVLVDGSSASMPDTPALQKAFPQPAGQKPGCGFPVMRLVGLFCWASGCLL